MLTQLCNEPGASRRIIPVDEPQDADRQLEPLQQPTIYFRSGRRENHPQRPLRRPGLSCPVADDLKQRLRSRAAVFFHRPLPESRKKTAKNAKNISLSPRHLPHFPKNSHRNFIFRLHTYIGTEHSLPLGAPRKKAPRKNQNIRK